MSYNGPRVPLHWQKGGMEKAIKKNPSYESARDNQIHDSQYGEMVGTSSIHDQSRIRRYPNGELDYQWAMNTILDAIKLAEDTATAATMTPMEESLLTVMYPNRFQKVEQGQAEIRTQLSRSEKAYLKEMLDAQLKEELNWNSGFGGGNTEGRGRTMK